nr:cupin domain-containing protein [Streptomyces scopuliridis]
MTELVLRPGDLLYLPRGWWHSVAASEGEHSLHLTFGIQTTTGAQLLSWLADDLRRHDVLREDLPVHAPASRQTAYLERLRMEVTTALRNPHLVDRYTAMLICPDQAMQFIAVRDIGRIVAAVFGSPDRYTNRTVEIAGDALTGKALAEHLTRAAGRPIGYSRLPTTLPAHDEVLGKLSALADDGGLAGNANLDALRAEFPFLLRFDRRLAGRWCGPPRQGAPFHGHGYRSALNEALSSIRSDPDGPRPSPPPAARPPRSPPTAPRRPSLRRGSRPAPGSVREVPPGRAALRGHALARSRRRGPVPQSAPRSRPLHCRYSFGSAAQARSSAGRCPVVRNAVTASFAHVLRPNG